MLDDPKALKGKARDASMFMDWYSGMSFRQLGAKYGISHHRVSVIKKDRDWKSQAAKLTQVQYEGQVDTWKRMMTNITAILEKDSQRLLSSIIENDTKTLTPEDRTHLRALLENLNKATRLVQGESTDNITSTGVVEHRVILPPGVTAFGVLPPADNVKFVTAEVSDPQDTPVDE